MNHLGLFNGMKKIIFFLLGQYDKGFLSTYVGLKLIQSVL